MVATRQTRAPLSPSNSIRKIKTAFSPLSSPVSTYSGNSNSMPSSPTCSRSTSASRLSYISTHSFRQIRNIIRRKPSTVELEQEEERNSCADELLCLVEPRPVAPTYVGGIEEVLFGRL